MPKNGTIPPEIHGGNLFYRNSSLYFAGGRSDLYNFTNLNGFYRYDLQNNMWIDISSANTFSTKLLYGGIILEDWIYIFSSEEIATGPSFYQVNLLDPSFSWAFGSLGLASDGILSKDAYGYCLVNTTLYVFGGIIDSQPKNMLSQLDKLENSVNISKVYHNFIAPSSRMHHTLVTIGEYLFLFGGQGDNNEYLNDIWAYDTYWRNWTSVEAHGNIPAKRSGHASASFGDLMMIWGGANSNGYLNDLYQYCFQTNTWKLLPTKTLVPSPRKGSCMAVYENIVLIYGGMTESGVSSEFWYFDMITNEYQPINTGVVDGPGPRYGASCQILVDDFYALFYVMFGQTEDGSSSNAIHAYDWTNGVWYEIHDDSQNTTWSRSQAAVYMLKNRVIVAGGESFGLLPSDDVFYYDMGTDKFTKIGTLPHFSYGAASAYFQSTLYIHGGASTIGMLMRINIPTNKFLKIDLLTDCEDTLNCYWPCSPGSYLQSKCEACPTGTYNDKFGARECNKCSRGKYNSIYGASIKRMCYPCEVLTYSDHSGSPYCLICPKGSVCKAGSQLYSYLTFYSGDKSE